MGRGGGDHGTSISGACWVEGVQPPKYELCDWHAEGEASQQEAPRLCPAFVWSITATQACTCSMCSCHSSRRLQAGGSPSTGQQP